MDRKERKVKNDLTWLWKTIRSQYWTYFILLLALLGCLYTMNNATEAYEACNEYWTEQLKDNGCSCSGLRVRNEMLYTDESGHTYPSSMSRYIKTYNGSQYLIKNKTILSDYYNGS